MERDRILNTVFRRKWINSSILISFVTIISAACAPTTAAFTPSPVTETVVLETVIETEVAATLTPSPTDLPTSTSTAMPSSTATPIGTPIPFGGQDIQEFTFAVCSDSHVTVGESLSNGIYLDVLRRIEEDEAAFFVNTGDITDRGGVTTFRHFAEIMSEFTIPFFPVPGNHDSFKGIIKNYLDYSGAPAAQYSWDYGQGHFVVVDSHNYSLHQRQLDWLETDLAGTDQPLKIVFLHHPPVVFEPSWEGEILRHGRVEFRELMEKYEVAYVFAGHMHSYAEIVRNGVQYIFNGGCGGAFYNNYVRVHISGTSVETEVVRVNQPQP